ncbi:MAG: porin [Ignavibacteria bacterium]|nr:porin [Ignavibacteria bacterium]
MKTKSLLVLLFGFLVTTASAQNSGTTFDIYGFVMTDAGYDFYTQDPNWYDVMRPTKLPSFKGEFEPDGKTYFSVRQTRFGVKSSTPTSLGEFKTQFEFELFGTGVDAGQTTFRLRHAYGELGKFGAGQYWSPFMDVDVFPNSLEYWGPNGMVFFRNIQVRYMPIQGQSKLTFALEKPGASGDGGIYSDRIEVKDIKPQFYLPDFSAEYRYGDKFGYVELAGILRSIKWVDTREDTLSLDGSALGWGINLSSNLNITKNDVLRLQGVYGEGVENYMNDAPADIGLESNTGDPKRPVKGVPLPVYGIVAFLDHTWSKYFTSSVGYSLASIDNTDGQAGTAFKKGQYALANLLYYPVSNMMAGVEYQWIQRDNKDGFKSKDMKVQFSFRWNFSRTFSM